MTCKTSCPMRVIRSGSGGDPSDRAVTNRDDIAQPALPDAQKSSASLGSKEGREVTAAVDPPTG
jgi:hypothetical protein